MMRALWEQKGATLSVNIVTDPRAVDFIDAHADALSSSFTQVQMSERMRARLERSTWIFSGMKAIREMGEAFPSLLDENGEVLRSYGETYTATDGAIEPGEKRVDVQQGCRWKDGRKRLMAPGQPAPVAPCPAGRRRLSEAYRARR